MAASEYDDYGPVAPSPTRTAIDILRARFPQFLRDNEDATLSYDPTGSLAVKNARDTRLGELEDRLVNDEASAAIPHEGYVQGEPGRRMRSNAPDVFNMIRTRGQLRNLSAEAAADPYTGEAEQGRVDDVRNALTTASLTTRPELEDAAHAVASRNAFGDFLKKQAGYKAETSPEGVAALDAESQRKIAQAKVGPLVAVDDPEHPGSTKLVTREQALGSQGPATAQERNRQAMAGGVLPHFAPVSDLLDQAEKANVLGPLAGRTVGDFLAKGVGSTGDPQTDALLSSLNIQMKMIASGFASLHGRGGANAGVGKEIENALYQTKMSPAAIRSALGAIQSWTQGYAKGTNGLAPGETAAAPAAGGTVQMRAPDGSVQSVPAAQVEHYRKLGATVVP